ncbi:MAG: hypothetical protein A3H35_09915 [Betaproteobacteria bacterium RIFCSPLOWO2_02_FULL_62_17]|nr:MAG: hypothetical protein A3H35_09915 [Betaproteobacteria bacterium RIFCSPLOWO2_02_FULL_62_17]
MLIVALWLCVSATSAWAQQADIARADALMKQGNAAAAFAILDPLEDKMAGDVNFDYLFGISALDSGKADRATIAFERVLAVNPNNAGARLDMARAYFQLGDLERAKNEFETVRGQNPPPAVAQVVTTYLDTIEKAQAAKRRQLRFYVEGTVGRDSNVNNSTSQSQIGIPALNNVVFTLNPSNVKLRDSFSSAAGGVDFLEQVRPNIAIFAGGDARKRVNFTQDTFDNSSLDGRVGVLLGAASNQLRLGTTGGRYTLDNTTNRKTSGVNGEWKYQLNPANQVNLFSQYTRTRFLDAATRVNSFNQSTSGVGWLRIFGDGKAAIFGTYFMGNERDPEGRADGAKNFDGVRIGGQYSLMQNIDLFAVASAQAGKYERQNAAFLTKRGDDQSDLVLGGTWRFARDWSLRPQLVHSRNTSNIPIYAFKRTEVSFTVRRDFN